MDKVTLNNKEQNRLLELNEVPVGRVTGQEAAEMLGLSLIHTRRLLAKNSLEGMAGLAHGNRRRRLANKIDETIEAAILYWTQGEYCD